MTEEDYKREESIVFSKTDFSFIIFNVIHLIFFLFYFLISIQKIINTFVEVTVSLTLLGGAFLAFIIKNPFYYHLYLGGYICSFIISPYIPYILIVLIPEFLFILASSKGSIIGSEDHDNLFGSIALGMGIRMDRGSKDWKPTGTDEREKEAEEAFKNILNKKKFMWFIVIITVIGIIIFYWFAFNTLDLNFPLEF
ncbi:MAG: hypothetical protein ACQERB_05945 [Promethearchaeati archaeon]